MNKKVFLGCSFILASTLVSCNNGFTRDSFKEVSQDDFISVLNNIKTNSTPANLNNKGKVSFVNNIKHYSKINNLLYWDVNYTRKCSYEWSEEDNYVKFTYDISGRYDYEEGEYFVIDTKESYTTYIKKIDNNFYHFSKNNIVGTKYKNKLDDITSIKAELKEILKVENQYISPMYFDVCETIAGSSSFALSKGYLMPSIYGEESLFTIYGNKEAYQKSIDKFKGNSVVNFGSNDEQSASYKIKGTITAQNYLNMMQGEDTSTIKNPTGNVNLDYYFSFKNNFFSQSESSNKYDIAYEVNDGDEVNKHTCVNDCYFNLQSRLGECKPDTINADQYIEIEVE